MRVGLLVDSISYEIDVVEIDDIYFDIDYGLVMQPSNPDDSMLFISSVKEYSEVEDILIKLLVHGWADLTMLGEYDLLDLCASEECEKE